MAKSSFVAEVTFIKIEYFHRSLLTKRIVESDLLSPYVNLF